MSEVLPLAEAVEAYNELRQPGNDHGIMGAYTALVTRYGRAALPSHQAIMEARTVRVPRYAATLDHRFSGDEQREYDSLKAAGRSRYDSLRWYGGMGHVPAFARARAGYGSKGR